jgi:hypothetical protein
VQLEGVLISQKCRSARGRKRVLKEGGGVTVEKEKE